MFFFQIVNLILLKHRQREVSHIQDIGDARDAHGDAGYTNVHTILNSLLLNNGYQSRHIPREMPHLYGRRRISRISTGDAAYPASLRETPHIPHLYERRRISRISTRDAAYPGGDVVSLTGDAAYLSRHLPIKQIFLIF